MDKIDEKEKENVIFWERKKEKDAAHEAGNFW